MALTKKQIKSIEGILSDMERTEKYLFKDSTKILIQSRSTPEHTYINKKTGIEYAEFNKHIGNELCYLYSAIGKLKNLMNEQKTKKLNLNKILK